MCSCWYYNYVRAILITNCEQGDFSAFVTFAQSTYCYFILCEGYELDQVCISVGETIGKLDTVGVIWFEKIAKMKLIRNPSLLIIVVGIRIQDLGAATSPFAFLCLTVTYFHPLIIQARTLGKPFDNKFRLPLNPFHYEIKPCGDPLRVNLLHECDLIGGRCYFLNRLYIARLEITPKYGIPNGNNFTIRAHLLPIFLIRI